MLRYSAESWPAFRYGVQQRPAALHALTALPPGSNPRTRALAAELRADPALAQADTPALVQAVLERLRSGGYTYTWFRNGNTPPMNLVRPQRRLL